MTDILADGNLLIALTVSDHVHHAAARTWFESVSPRLATCPITQGTLVRFLIREGVSTELASNTLTAVTEQDWHRFWAADIPVDRAMLRGVIGHRQVTDAYLVALAGHFGGTLATFDRGLAALHGDSVILIDG